MQRITLRRGTQQGIIGVAAFTAGLAAGVPAFGQCVLLSQSRSVSAQALSSANGNTDTEGPVTRLGPDFGADWSTLNSALASTSVVRASAGASSSQLSSFTPGVIRAQGSTSTSAILSASATTGSVQTRGESVCVFFFVLPANQRLEVIASQSGTGVVRISRVSTDETLFSGSGVQVLRFSTGETLRFEGSALATISSTTVPTNASSGGSYSVILTNLDVPVTAPCDGIDFNNNQLFPEDQDLIDFLSVLAGGPCSTGNGCNDIDFNNDGLFPSDDDLIAFLRVLAGGGC
jgi:hypothetical protein